MMMLIFSVIVMCSYFYSVCLASRALTITFFKEHLSVAASKYSICDIENKIRNLHYVQCSNIAPVKKAWFMASMEYTLIIFSPNGKCMVVVVNRFVWFTFYRKQGKPKNYYHNTLFKSYFLT